MGTAAISTLSLSLILRGQIRRSQTELATAQVELASGRREDMGLALGHRTGRNIAWHEKILRLEAISDANGLAASRARLSQDTMTAIRTVAGTFLDTLAGARSAADGQDLAREAAKLALESLTDALNTSYNGQAIFGGINSAASPIAAYPASPAKAAVDGAFFAAFGVAQTDPAVSGISAASMQGFLDTQFANLFSNAAWSSTWSQASDTVLTSRIDADLSVSSSVSANAEPFRMLAKAFTMVLDLGAGNLNQQAFESIVDTALSAVTGAVAKLGDEQAKLGLAQSSIASAQERIGLKLTVLARDIQATESVDSYEAATRVNLLMTQLEASYSLTGRIGRLSLLNYL